MTASVAIIVGATVGGVGGLLLFAYFATFWWLKKRRVRGLSIIPSDHRSRGVGDYGETNYVDFNPQALTFYNPRDLWKPTDLEKGLPIPKVEVGNPIRRPSPFREELIRKELVHTLGNFSELPFNEFHESGVFAPVQSLDSATNPFDYSSYILQHIPSTPKPTISPPSPQKYVPEVFISCEFPPCTRTFKARHEYNRHQKSHTHPEPCPQCGRGFETIKDVNRHVNSVHQKTKSYHCPVPECQYSRNSTAPSSGGFSRKDNLRRHMKRCHGV